MTLDPIGGKQEIKAMKQSDKTVSQSATRAVSLYTSAVIRSFAHKGLETFFGSGSMAGVRLRMPLGCGANSRSSTRRRHRET